MDYRCSFCRTEDMPEQLVETDLDIVYDKLDKLLGALTFVEHLSICSTYSSKRWVLEPTRFCAGLLVNQSVNLLSGENTKERKIREM
ncbi:hypothetical protein YC2023_022105 [Brassica napus]